MASSPLKVLPREIIDLIIGKLPRPDLKSVRLTCHTLNDHATRWLYRNIYLLVLSLDEYAFGYENDFPKLVKKYGHLVHQLELEGDSEEDYEWDDAFNALRYLEYMPFLQHLRMEGNGIVYSGRDYLPFPKLKDLVQQATLYTPSEDRALRNIISLQLQLTARRGQSECLGEFGALFIIPQLQKLEIRDFILTPEDPRLPGEFPRHTAFGFTDLKTLSITHAHIDIRAIARILVFPSALAHLRLGHVKDFDTFFRPDPAVALRGFVGETQTKEDLCQAILQQRNSLETLNITGWDESPPSDGSLYLIPRLRANKGNFRKWFTGAL